MMKMGRRHGWAEAHGQVGKGHLIGIAMISHLAEMVAQHTQCGSVGLWDSFKQILDGADASCQRCILHDRNKEFGAMLFGQQRLW